MFKFGLKRTLNFGCCSNHPNADEVFGEFCKESTLHGVKYIGSSKRSNVERVFWAIAVLCMLGLSLYMVENVFDKYFHSPVIVSYQPIETATSQIPFPAITICNVNILKRQVFKKFLIDLDLELEKENYTVSASTLPKVVLTEHLIHFCVGAPSTLRRWKIPIMDPDGGRDFVGDVEKVLLTAKRNFTDEYRNSSPRPGHSQTRDFYNEASQNCLDMILKCVWSRKEIPCKEIFYEISTQNGRCCVFNMMPKYLLRKIPKSDYRYKNAKMMRVNQSPEAYSDWEAFKKPELILTPKQASTARENPKRQKAGGKPYGLSILINPDFDKFSTCSTNDAWGMKMVAHSPISFPSIMEYGMAVPPNREVFVEIEPQVSTANEKEFESVNLGKRGCYLGNDEETNLKKYNFYTAPNCFDECVAEHTFINCSCVQYFMPRTTNQSLCGAKKRDCAEKILYKIAMGGKTGFCAKCWPSCTEIVYKMRMSHFPLHEHATSRLYDNTFENENLTLAKNLSILHIYLGSDSIYAMERKRLYDTLTLIGNAGGLLSLTLGFSVVSLIEILYFCTCRAWFQARHRKKINDQVTGQGFYSAELARPVKMKDSKTSSVVQRKSSLVRNYTRDYYNWAMNTNVPKIAVVSN